MPPLPPLAMAPTVMVPSPLASAAVPTTGAAPSTVTALARTTLPLASTTSSGAPLRPPRTTTSESQRISPRAVAPGPPLITGGATLALPKSAIGCPSPLLSTRPDRSVARSSPVRDTLRAPAVTTRSAAALTVLSSVTVPSRNEFCGGIRATAICDASRVTVTPVWCAWMSTPCKPVMRVVLPFRLTVASASMSTLARENAVATLKKMTL
jgi:hypothetical protein